MAVAEAWAETPQRLARYIGPDELHQAFSFDFLDATWSADSFRKVIDTALAEATIVGAPTTWVLSNHDKQRHVTRYGDGEVGLRRARAASAADARPARLRLPLPGRGAGPAGGARPPRRAAPGPVVPAYRREPRRLPGAASRGAATCRRTASGRPAASRAGCRPRRPGAPSPSPPRPACPARRWSCTGPRCGSGTPTRRWPARTPGVAWLETAPGVLAFPSRRRRRRADLRGQHLSGARLRSSGYGRVLLASAAAHRAATAIVAAGRRRRVVRTE